MDKLESGWRWSPRIRLGGGGEGHAGSLLSGVGPAGRIDPPDPSVKAL